MPQFENYGVSRFADWRQNGQPHHIDLTKTTVEDQMIEKIDPIPIHENQHVAKKSIEVADKRSLIDKEREKLMKLISDVDVTSINNRYIDLNSQQQQNIKNPRKITSRIRLFKC